MKRKIWTRSLVCLVLALALLAGAVPTALAEGVQAVVKSSSAKVYAVAAPHKPLGTLKQGVTVTVEKYNATVAQIRYNGKTGLMYVKDLKRADSAPAQASPAQSAPAASAKAVIAICDTKAYAKPSTSSAATTIKAGTELKLLAVSGSVAKVERGGVTAYVNLNHLGEPGSAIQTAPAQAAPAAQETPTITWNKAVVTVSEARIYQKPSASSAYLTVPKGTRLTLVASKGNVAQVTRDGKTGYMALTSLADAPAQSAQTTPSTPAQTTPATPAETPAQAAQTTAINTSEFVGSSNKEIIYNYLMNQMGYNAAAAAGVLANIKYESNYKPDDVGDNGTSYGIVQWHAGHMSQLISWCENKGLDYTTLPAQLMYLKYEMANKYTKVNNYLKSVEDSPQGAYDAAYYFCYYYEIPSNKASKADTRGKYARDTLYKK